MANRVRELRRLKGWSIPDLQRASGISCGHISEIERGKVSSPTLPTAVRLARALGVSIQELFPDHVLTVPRERGNYE